MSKSVKKRSASRASNRPLSIANLFEAVQAKLSEQVNGHKAARMKSEGPADRPYLR